MQIDTNQDGAVFSASVIGDINSGNADELMAALRVPEDVTSIDLDLAQMPYISSAGLRAILMAEKAMKKVGGKMVIHNVQPDVMEIFKITGFANILTIE